MVIDTAQLQSFVDSGKKVESSPNITPVTSLDQIKDGSNVLVFGKMGNDGGIYIQLFEQIALTEYRPDDTSSCSQLKLGVIALYADWTEPDKAGLHNYVGGMTVHYYLCQSQVDEGNLYFVNGNQDIQF